MSQFKDAAVGSTVYFWFAANTTTGTAGDGATPLYDVRLAGAGSTVAPTASGTPTLLTHANYADGLHEIAIDTTGYSAGSEYAVFCTLTISAVNPSGFVGSFVVRAAASTLYDLATAILADTAVIGTPAGASIAADLVVIDNFVDGLETTIGAAGAGLTGIVLAKGTGITGFNDLDAAGVAAATWNAATATYGSAGSYGLLVETNLDAAVTTRMATFTQPTGFLAATFPASVASPTNITTATGITVVTNSDKTGYALTVTPPTAIENADALLNRDMATGTDSGSPTVRTVRQALRFLRNKWSMTGATLTVTKEDDVTASWTATVSTDAAALPITGSDPA